MDKQGIHCIVSGKVQGVFYRANVQDKARQLGLTGWVRNLASGEVELTAYGHQEELDEFAAWLWRGPLEAEVKHVAVNQVAYQETLDFMIKYD